MEMETGGGGMIRMHCIQVRNCQRINERYTQNCFLKDPVPKNQRGQEEHGRLIFGEFLLGRERETFVFSFKALSSYFV